MGIKNSININTCTATDILDYFRDIIKDDLEEIIYKLYDSRLHNIDKDYIDEMMEQINLTDAREIKRARANMIYSLLEQAPQNTSYTIKVKILYEIYSKYHKELSKPEHSKKMKKLKEIILEDKNVVVLSHRVKNRRLEYEIITMDEPKNIASIRDEQSKKIIGEALNSMVSTLDLADIIKYDGLASNIVRKCLIDFYYLAGASAEDVDSIVEDETFKDDIDIMNPEKIEKFLGDSEILEAFNSYLTKFLKDNIQLINTNTLLLNAATRIILGIRVNNGEEITEVVAKENLKQEEFEEAMRNSIDFLTKIYEELSKKVKNKFCSYTLYTQNGEEIVKVDLEYIEEFLSKCTESRYYSEGEIECIHENIKLGILPNNDKVRKIANININDLKNASISYDEKMSKNEETKTKLLSCSLEIIRYLKETGVITSDEQLLELYLNGDLSLDILDSAGMPEILEENYIEKFKILYEGIKQDDEENTNKKKFAKYSELYKRFMSRGKLDKDNLVENLVEQYGEESGNKILIDLYNLGMINLEDCINWAGTDILKKLFQMEERNIQPNQINSLYHNKMLSLNEIANLILMIPDVEERYITIASIFPDMSESEERQELLYKTIKVEKTLNKRSRTENVDPVPPNPTNEYNKHITDSTYRFNLIRLFDKEFFMEMTADGHAIIRLPKFKKVMIEKMLDTKKEEGYGAATYILDEDYYLANKDEIKEDGKINRRELKAALKEGNATRIFHIVNSWGEQIKTYFTELPESQYTEYEQQMIDEAIETIKNSVKIIGVGKND